MERLTCKYEGLFAFRDLCTFDKNNECIDCASCAACCEEKIIGDCATCPIQTAIEKLAEYEDAEEQGLLLIGKCHCEKCIHHVRTDCGSTTIYCTKHECYMYEKNFCKDGEALKKMQEDKQ